MHDPSTEAILELLWGHWTELGVPGVKRSQVGVAIDPEPLVVYTPWLARADSRLLLEALGWCDGHRESLSVSRITGLLRRAPAEVREAHSVFANESVGDRAAPPLPKRRPSLIRLRLRALCGVGTRADVMAELLARSDRWTSATDLVGLGFSKRNIARVLAELGEAGIVRVSGSGNRVMYQLDQSTLWDSAVGSGGLEWIPFVDLFQLATVVAKLQDLGAKSPVVQRVDSAKLQPELVRLADGLGVPRPPVAGGNAELRGELLDWGTRQVVHFGHARDLAGSPPHQPATPSPG